MIRILILDDEEAACNILSILIRKNMPYEHEIRTEQDPVKALQMLDTFRPTLVMLDIEMPGMNGFDFLNKAGSWDFDVIFTTAFDQYAIKAIRFSALDYLLKPLDIVELQNALNRHIIRRNLSQQSRKDLVHNLIENVQRPDADEYRLALSTTEGVFFYLPSEIIRCEGESNYTTFYLEHAKPLIVSHTLKEYESLLSDYGFSRVHKSHLVNMKYVSRMDRDGFLWLQNGESVPVSRRRKEEVMRILKKGG
ncbi:MAG TPA: LytTR family DNA-binding domain-containing protein [Saprospiraceae bacterium]|nr:LytTR family DNA-binding domain-containing protein [Saprospiraceae bacterium]